MVIDNIKNKEQNSKINPDKPKVEIPTVVTLRKRKISIQETQNNQNN